MNKTYTVPAALFSEKHNEEEMAVIAKEVGEAYLPEILLNVELMMQSNEEVELVLEAFLKRFTDKGYELYLIQQIMDQITYAVAAEHGVILDEDDRTIN